MEKLYTTSAHSIGGRHGHVATKDGFLSFDLSIPKKMGGSEKPKTTNPEQLFASSYAACFGSALEYVAKQQQLTLQNIQVDAYVSLGKNTNGGFDLAVELKIYLPELTQAIAKKLAQAAHQICPYSNATRGNIEVKLTVVDKL